MNGLNVNGEELMNAKGEIDALLDKFNSETNSLYRNLNELNNYWIGDDYLSTKTLVENNTKSFLDENDGSIPNLLREISRELEQKTNNYENIQRENMREEFYDVKY